MTDSLADRVLVQLDERTDNVAGPTVQWHRLIPWGTFTHPRYGKLDFRDAFLGALKANFDNRARGIDIPIDFHHDETSEAGGWIRKTEVRPGDGLWGEVEWTDLGEEKVRKKRLRYFSAEFGPHKDEKTGVISRPVLAAVTLTNRPFLKYQEAIQLSEDAADGEEVALMDLTETDEAALAEPSAGQQVQAKTAKKKSGPGAREGDEDDEKKPSDDEEDDEDEDEDEEAKGPRTEPAPPAGSQSRVVTKKSTKKPAGNQGAPQPGQMRGPKPHITRGRRPDPTSEANHMSDATNEQAAETVALEEFQKTQELASRLSARLDEKDNEAKALREQLAAMQLRERTRDVKDEVRRLAEDRTVTLGEETKPAKYGVPAVATQAYEAMALSEEGFSQAGVYALLAQLKAVGMVALTEAGTGRDGVEHDPDATAPASLSEDEKIFARAQKLAEASGKAFATLPLSEREALMFEAERQLRA